MALFGNKSKDPNGSAAPASAPDDSGKKGRGLSFGRKKDTAPAPTTPTAPATGNGATAGGIEDFSDFSEAALATPDAETTGKKGKAKKAKAPAPKKKLKSGTVVGLNVGNDSIKAVELKIKGDAISVTAMGMVPTPAESISNGVVMSVSSLGHAIRDLFKESGFSSHKVVSSVAGTGALVVRVIEVPQMDDKELANNMKVDADRYIPFPPSEVIMDFKALRELPTDPASGNMEVLLAAAQREIIDLHINVLQDAKLDAGAIDVEPLAAARTVAYSSGTAGNNGTVDYNDVSAILNIGATGTEISVLRGDILVFTRAIPIGGHVFTQQIVDNLGLPWHDAERLKCDMGDALPPHPTVTADMPGNMGYGASGAGATAPTDDWSAFNSFDEEPAPTTAAAPGGATPDTSILDEEWPTPAATDGGAATTGTTPSSGNATADPFDLDFFSQGPRNEDPKEQHGQKEEEEEGKPVQSFDFSNFSLDEPAPATPAHPANAVAAEPSSTTTPAAEPAKPPSFNFSFPEDVPTASTATVPPASTPEPAGAEATPAPAPQVSSFSGFSFDTPEPEPATSTPAPTEAGPPLATSPTAEAAGHMAEIHPASPSAYDISDIEATGAHSATAGAAPDPLTVGATPIPAADDFDIDNLFNAGPSTSTTAAPTIDISAPTPVAAAPTDDFGADFDDFGLGLTATNTGVVGTGSDAEAVHAIIRPLLEELAGEVRRSLEYYASRYPDTVVRHVTLIGGGAKLKNIDAFFTQMLGIPSTVGNPMARLTVDAPKLTPGYADQNGPIFAVAVGLALRDVV
ncbi:MAG: type IV pilus assembly protein PilM [Abitibacteriaceae bacterium]|nr:type IV pilus assembly protein PilM [Abditibacteriaceae bacterium]